MPLIDELHMMNSLLPQARDNCLAAI